MKKQLIETVTKIYEYYLNQIGSNNEFSSKFYKNHGTLLSILLRKWLSDTIRDYQKFLQ